MRSCIFLSPDRAKLAPSVLSCPNGCFPCPKTVGKTLRQFCTGQWQTSVIIGSFVVRHTYPVDRLGCGRAAAILLHDIFVSANQAVTAYLPMRGNAAPMMFIVSRVQSLKYLRFVGLGSIAVAVLPFAGGVYSRPGLPVNPSLTKETPRLCRGGSRSLTIPGVHRGDFKT